MNPVLPSSIEIDRIIEAACNENVLDTNDLTVLPNQVEAETDKPLNVWNCGPLFGIDTNKYGCRVQENEIDLTGWIKHEFSVDNGMGEQVLHLFYLKQCEMPNGCVITLKYIPFNFMRLPFNFYSLNSPSPD